MMAYSIHIANHNRRIYVLFVNNILYLHQKGISQCFDNNILCSIVYYTTKPRNVLRVVDIVSLLR